MQNTCGVIIFTMKGILILKERELYENRKWQESNLVYRQGELLNFKRGFFAKITYLWRF
jgi:hypothetical protein